MTPDTKKFPEPHRYGTHISYRNPGFKTHTSLAQCKNAISGKSNTRRGTRQIGCDAYVYEWTEDAGWSLLHFIPKDTDLDAHPFYQTSSKRGAIKGPSDTAVAKAIESILSVGGSNE